MPKTIRVNLKVPELLHYQFKNFVADCGSTLQESIVFAMGAHIEDTEFALMSPPKSPTKQPRKKK